MIVVCFNIFLWLKAVQIYPIIFIQNHMNCIDIFSADYIIDIIIGTAASILQLSLRLYLKYVKKIKSSNELLSIKFILVVLSCTISYLLPLPDSSLSYLPPLAIILAIMITIVIFDHSGLNQYFMENHPYFRSALSHLMVYFQSKCNHLQNVFLDFCRTNQIHPYEVAE